jgi:hypothetical protein
VTRQIARAIAFRLKCDIEEIVDLKYSWKDAFQGKLTEIGEIKKDLGLYEVVFIGTPTLKNAISGAVRTFIHKNKHRLKKVAFFCAGFGSGDIAFREMALLCGKTPITTLSLSKGDMKKSEYMAKINEFTTNPLALMASDLWERTEKKASKAPLVGDLQELRQEYEAIYEFVNKLSDSIERKQELMDILNIVDDQLNVAIDRLEQKRN